MLYHVRKRDSFISTAALQELALLLKEPLDPDYLFESAFASFLTVGSAPPPSGRSPPRLSASFPSLPYSKPLLFRGGFYYKDHSKHANFRNRFNGRLLEDFPFSARGLPAPVLEA
jgi:hypothetical protein